MSRCPGTGAISREKVVVALCAVAAFALVATKLVMQVRAGVAWDTYAYAANALAIAGRSIGYTEPFRSPGLSLLAAPAYALGPIAISTIQIVDALVSLSGAAALFLLLRRRFEVLPTLLGTLTFLVLPPVWTWIGVGYTDVSSIALALWATLFFVKATEDDPTWYYAALPMSLAAVLVRVTAILVVLPLGVWVLLRWRPFRHARQIVGGAVIALCMYAPLAYYYLRNFGNALYTFVVSFQISEDQHATGDIGMVEPGVIGGALLIVGALVLLTVASGLLQAIVDWLASDRRPSAPRLLIAVAAIAAALLATRSTGGLIATQGVIVASCFVVWSVLAPRDDTGRVDAPHALDALMVAWLLAFGVWFLGNPIQVPRYQITFIPGLVYVVLLGLDAWAARFRSWRSEGAREGRAAETLVWVGLALTIVVALYLDVSTMPREPGQMDAAYEGSALWLASHDPGVQDRTVLSDVWPYTSWFLRMNVDPMPRFENPRALMHELEKRDADYYFARETRSFEPTFTTIANESGLRVLERVRPARTDLPRVRYLGDVWQNYLEEVTDFRFFLDSNSPAHGWKGSAYLDEYSAEELRSFDVVAAYGFRWRKRVTGERTLEEYVRDGGVLVIDATGNFSNPDFPLDGTALFGVAIERQALATSADWQLAPAFARDHPEIGPMESTPWLDESSQPWVGATYHPLRVVEGWHVLASVGGVPAVAVQDLGNGRIYWLAYNLAWHAFSTDNANESRLVGAVFDDALAFRASQMTP